jgi:hypothetical protein
LLKWNIKYSFDDCLSQNTIKYSHESHEY